MERNNLPAKPQDIPETLEGLVVYGDLKRLTPEQRVQWYQMRCEATGLDWRTKPFDYIELQGKLTLYATKAATDQLCAIHRVTTEIIARETQGDVYVVTCRASTPDGRRTEDIGAVPIGNLRGDALCNALMKATTKAKRRAVLSLCGLGMLDETETETIASARRPQVDAQTGEILDAAPESRGDAQAPRYDVRGGAVRAMERTAIERGLGPAPITGGGEVARLRARLAAVCAEAEIRDPAEVRTICATVLNRDVEKISHLSPDELERVIAFVEENPTGAQAIVACPEEEQSEALPFDAEAAGVPAGLVR